MIIDLNTIDAEGKDYHFTQDSDELVGAFKDLIGKADYSINLFISPLGNTYQITGAVKSQYPERCSRCGYDIDVPLQAKINEIVVIEKQRPRNTQGSQSQPNFESDGPQVTYLNSPDLNLEEFLHEMMAAGFDKYPKCSDRKKCDEQRYEIVDEVIEEPKGHPGFAALKNFKTKH